MVKVVAAGILTLAKLGVLATAVILATTGLAEDTKPASASHTEIFFSYSSEFPVPAPVIVVNPGTPRVVYVWAAGVDDPTGVSGFQVDFTFDGTLFNVFAFQAETDWLASTQRAVTCSPPPVIEESRAYLGCNTLLPPPPIGPQDDGLLATIGLLPVPVLSPSSTLDMTAQGFSNGTLLLSTPFDLEPKLIQPLALQNSILVFMKCGDNSGDGYVDLFNDIVGVINRYAMVWDDPATWPAGLTWSDAYDLDENGTIDLFNDILGTIMQYGLYCNQP